VSDPAFVALSLLPLQLWKRVGEWLRAGQAPGTALDRIIDDRWPGEPERRADLMARARLALERGAQRGLEVLAWSDAQYPLPLTAIVDPPPVLWIRGSPAAFGLDAVAIVGSRAASPYALDVAERLSADLASRGYAVVSGLARGVDSAAHRGAVSAGGSTIAVLGCGADVMYPPEHAALAAAIVPRGLLLSELVPGTRPLPHYFPQRNRIISGLSRAVVIVEAGERSGSLITARCALEQGRDVLAVPGNVLSGRNRGGHALLRDGARIVETADDIVEELHGVASRVDADRRRSATAASGDPLLACLIAGEAADADEIAQRTGLAMARLLARLAELELHGMIARVGGGRFIRVDRSC
jgi:DNA processing protein